MTIERMVRISDDARRPMFGLVRQMAAREAKSPTASCLDDVSTTIDKYNFGFHPYSRTCRQFQLAGWHVNWLVLLVIRCKGAGRTLMLADGECKVDGESTDSGQLTETAEKHENSQVVGPGCPLVTCVLDVRCQSYRRKYAYQHTNLTPVHL